MKEFLLIDENEIKLNSGLNEYMFGKTSYSSIVNQAGILYDGEKFVEWTFNDVRSIEVEGKEEPQVFYCGNNPLSKNAKTLIEYFEGGDRNLMFTAALEVCKMITKAAEENFPLPTPAASSILLDISASTKSILLLPPDLFKYSTAALSTREQANARGCWINETLSGLPSLCFCRATIAYTMLTGEYPFPAADTVERNADILDQKFLPLELQLPNVSPVLATEINNALKLTSSVVNLPGKKQKGKSSEELKPNASFPLDLLEKERNNIPSKELQTELSEKAQNYIKKRDSKINTKRTIRRNTSKILIISALVIILAFIFAESAKSHKKEYTTQGLTSTQTIQAFLQNVNKKDATMLGNFTSGKKASKYTDTVSQIYVLSKQRQTYGHDNGFATPENYFWYVTDAYKNQSSGLYGITHIKIDGEEYELNLEIPTFEQNLPSLQEENGVPLIKNIQTNHKVEYFLLHTEGEGNEIFVEYVTELYTLTFKGGRWVITDIDTSSEELELNSNHFKSEYFNLLKINKNDVLRSTEILSAQYPWVPSKESLQRERERLDELACDPFLGAFN